MPPVDFDLHLTWRADNGSRLSAIYRAQVLERDDARMGRLLVRLIELRRSGWEGGPPDESLERCLPAVVGKRAYVPPEALEGMLLPLKQATLTLQMRYFFD